MYVCLCLLQQVIAGRNPFNGRTAVTDDNMMEQILLKLQQFEKRVVSQENMIEKVLKENDNLQNSIQGLQKENVNVKDDMNQLQKQNMNLEDRVNQVQTENGNIKDGLKQVQQDNVNLQDGMKQLGKQNIKLEDNLNQVQTENVNLQSYIKQLQQEKFEQTDKITQLEKKLTEQMHECSQTKIANSKQDEDLDRIKGQVDSQQNNLVEMKKANEKCAENLEKIQGIGEKCLDHCDKQNSYVSFTAFASATRVYNEDDVVQFDGIVVNYGGFYNDSTGIFTCPYSGYYLFSVSVLAYKTRRMGVDISLDGSRVVGAHAEDPDKYDQGSVTATVKCDLGQQVWVRCIYDGDRMYGDGYKYSSFTGSLLRVV